MSFLLRTRNRNDSSRLIPGAASGRSGSSHGLQFGRNQHAAGSGGRQMQAQIYRHSIQTHHEQTETEQSHRQQQVHAQTDSAMAEVMKDLLILEQQQQDSQRKLELARLNKQRRLQEHLEQEAKLEQKRYIHGQKSAEAKRVREILSNAERLLGTTRLKAKTSQDDLHDYESSLKLYLTTYGKVQAKQRKLPKRVEGLRKAVAELHRLKEKAATSCSLAQQELEKAQGEVETVRQRVHARKDEAAGLSRGTAEFLDEISSLEKEVQTLESKQEEHRIRCSDSKSEIESNRNQVFHSIQASKESSGHHAGRMQVTKQHLQNEEERLAGLQRQFDQIVSQITSLQLDEQHIAMEPSNPVWKPLDVNRIRESAEAEKKAAVDEQEAVLEMQKTIERLKQELSVEGAELSEMKEKVLELKKQDEESSGVERDRRQGADDFFKQLDDSKTEATRLKEQCEELQSKQAREQKELRDKLHMIALEISHAERSLEEVTRTTSAVSSEVVELQAHYGTRTTADRSMLAQKKEYLALIRQKVRDLTAETSREQSSIPEGSETFTSSSSLRIEIDNILRANPMLEDVLITYRPELDIQQHADIELAPIVDLCRKRIDSAKKVRDSRREAATIREKERRKLEKEAAADAKRQFETQQHKHPIVQVEPNRKHSHHQEAMEEHMRKRREKHKHRNREKRENPRHRNEEEISAAKPRKLLNAFSLQEYREATSAIQSQSPSPEKKVHWSDRAIDGKQKSHVNVALSAGGYRETTQHPKVGKPRDPNGNVKLRDEPYAKSQLLIELHGAGQSASNERKRPSSGKGSNMNEIKVLIRGERTQAKANEPTEKLRVSESNSTASDRPQGRMAVAEKAVALKEASLNRKASTLTQGERRGDSRKQSSKRLLMRQTGEADRMMTATLDLDKSSSKSSIKDKMLCHSIRKDTRDKLHGEPDIAPRTTSHGNNRHEKGQDSDAKTAPSKRRENEVVSQQVSGIPSMERAPKSRRRKKTQSAGTTGSLIQKFGEDCSFDFHQT